MPRYEDIEWAGLGFTKEQFEQVMSLDREAWAKEVVDQESLFFNLRARLPKELINERQQLVSRL